MVHIWCLQQIIHINLFNEFFFTSFIPIKGKYVKLVIMLILIKTNYSILAYLHFRVFFN